MDERLIPDIPDWVLDVLQTQSKSFLLIVCDETSKRYIVGCVILETFKSVKPTKLTWRILRYIPQSEELLECALCKNSNDCGWAFEQKDIDQFICNSCFLGN